nr:PREDICTED: calmegin [Lepisosteus oculatus]
MWRLPGPNKGQFHHDAPLKTVRMKLRWGWTCLLLLSLATAAWTHEEDQDSTGDAQVEDSDDADSETEDPTANTNVSFQPFRQVTYKTPVPTKEAYFTETFDEGLLAGWVQSKTTKDGADDDISKYDGQQWFDTFILWRLVVQYEVNFQDGIDCGGAYMKLLSASDDLDLERFNDQTLYTIMFGPDKCGEDYKLHFIFKHKNPRNGDYEEKHAKRPDVDLKKFYTDKKPHLYTLVLSPDNTFEIFIDQTSVSKGNLLTDMAPPINPPKEIDDPNDVKPEEWDERPKIPDPDAVKPDDWDEDAPAKIEDPEATKPEGWLDDEPEYISDPTAEKPEDWDEEMDGEWEAPQIPNPACEASPGCGVWKPPMINNPNYKGKWKASLIENPSYQGIWSPRKIPNPDYFEDLHPFRMTPFSAVGLELWSMTSEIYFDNFIICSDKEVADRWASDGWGVKKLMASANEPGVFSQLMAAAEERPWLWVVYILTVALPVGLVVLFSWPRKSDEAASYKKTDDIQHDVLEDEEEEKEEEQEREEEADTETRADTGKAEEEEEEEEEKRSDHESGAAGDSQDEEEEDSNKSNETASDDEMKDADESIGDGPKQTARKRRVRKD